MLRRVLYTMLFALTVDALSARAGLTSGFKVTQAPYYSTDFESGLPSEFSAPGAHLDPVQGWSGLGPSGNTFGGHFLRYTAVQLYDTQLVLRNLPAHTKVSVGFLLAVIDSWDGTELLQLSVDSQQLFNHWFQLATGDASSYVAPPGGLLSSGTDLGYSSYYATHDRAYDMSLEPGFIDIPHTADSLVVVWRLGAISGPAADQWQGGDDESWAIDNVSVTLDSPVADVPSGPGLPALALSGALPNPSRNGRLLVDFVLPTGGDAQLELFDLAGRRLFMRDVGSLGSGRHVVDLDQGGRWGAGLYVIRLTQGSEHRTRRAVVTQ